MKHVLSFLIIIILATSITAQPVVIPVVFHILQQGGIENISDQQVLSAIQVLNHDYNSNLNGDTIIAEPFRNIAADMNIQFRLANIDPQGHCTNGIEHIFTTATNHGGDNTKWPLWPTNKYLNIWVVLEIGGNAAAYTYYPWQADTLSKFDGIITVNNYVGNIGTGLAFSSGVLTYEIGHYLGLLATCDGASNNICGDDSVADTPPCKYNDLCEPDSSCGEVVNYQNFMDYSYCGVMFTDGQKARVLQYLNRSAAGRNNLWTSNNLAATGTTDTTTQPCAPVCDFTASNSFICLGEPITYHDASYNGTETARTWTFSNSNISTSTDSAVTITYNSAGWQTVSLSVMNGQGSSQKTKTLVYVADPNAPAITPPYFTNFSDSADFNRNWISVNPDNDAPHFQQINSGGLSAVLLNNYDADSIYGMYDELISPAFDCTNLSIDSAIISFRYSLASRDAPYGYGYYGDIDSMAVYINDSCGYTWNKIYALGSASLFNGGYTDAYFSPGTNNSLWATAAIYLTNVMLSHYLLQTPVRFKIRVFGSENSNNFYLTDFAVGYVTTGVAEQQLNGISIQPNPFNNYVTINGLHEGKNKVTVYDLEGRSMMSETVAGNNESLNIDLSSVAANGIYFIKITGQQGSQTFKLVKD